MIPNSFLERGKLKMADEKKKGLFESDKIVLKAKPGFSLPVRYQDAWVRVTADEAVEFEVSDLSYEARISIQDAVDVGHVVDGGAVTPKAPEGSKYASVQATADAVAKPKVEAKLKAKEN